MNTKKWWRLGKTKDRGENIVLYDFEWACGWYWSGGQIGNQSLGTHFDTAFLNVPDIRGHCLGDFVTPWTPVDDSKQYVVLENGAALWSPLSVFLDDPQYDEQQWWRIKDLFSQFYALQRAAEVYQYGGHCTPNGRTPAEINKDMAAQINKHIETVIIPETRKALDKA